MEILFDVALWLFGANLLLSLLLFARLHEDPVSEHLFALPNAWLGPRPRYLSLRLLRAKFFLPWVESPSEMAAQGVWIRAAFWLARFTGAGFVIAIFSFLVSAFLVGVR
jgi:hypothetical protein